MPDLVHHALAVHAPDEMESSLVHAVMAARTGVLQQVPDLAAIDVARHAHVRSQARMQTCHAVPAG
jgi:hypothetical protein